MEISSLSQRYTAFNICYGTSKFLRLPQGLRTSPNSFQLLMDKILHNLTFTCVLCYVDDIYVFFLRHLNSIFQIYMKYCLDCKQLV